jgi:hypothetical protein
MNSEKVITEITFENVYQYVAFNSKITSNIIHLNWDSKNVDVNAIMSNEAHICRDYEYKSKYNAYWVNEIKNKFNWKYGDVIIFKIERLCIGHIKIIVHKNTTPILNCMKINEDGYLCVPYYERCHGYTNLIYIKCDCIYNDKLDGENDPYILKYEVVVSFDNL